MNKVGQVAMKYLKVLVVLLVLMGAVYIGINYYGYIFSRSVVGSIVNVERVQLNVALMQSGPSERLSPELYSFAVAIKDEKSGEIVVASSEDRRWAVAKTGQCAEARYFPYPPWRIDKSGTYYGAKLVKLSDCPVQP